MQNISIYMRGKELVLKFNKLENTEEICYSINNIFTYKSKNTGKITSNNIEWANEIIDRWQKEMLENENNSM